MPERRFVLSPINRATDVIDFLVQERERYQSLLVRINRSIPIAERLSEEGVFFTDTQIKREREGRNARLFKSSKGIFESAITLIDTYMELIQLEQVKTANSRIRVSKKPKNTLFAQNFPILKNSTN